MECPNCNTQTNKLVIYNDPKYLGCPSCGVPRKRFTLSGLGMTSDAWVGPKGEKHRVSVGKKWEMEQRQLTRDGQVINITTKKESEY